MLSAFLNRERHDPSRCAWRHGCAMSTGGRKSSSSYRTAPAWNGKRGGLLTHTKQPELVLAHRSGSPTGRTPADEKVTAATSIKKTATPSFIFTFRVEISGWKPCLVETANRGTQREGRRRFRGRQCRLAGLSALLKPEWTRLSHTLGHSTLIGTEQIKREYDTGSVTRKILNRKWRAGHFESFELTFMRPCCLDWLKWPLLCKMSHEECGNQSFSESRLIAAGNKLSMATSETAPFLLTSKNSLIGGPLLNIRHFQSRFSSKVLYFYSWTCYCCYW